MIAFRCSRTGVLYPADYYEKWGSRYGSGLGRMPVSEAVCTNYSSIPVPCVSNPEFTMHSTYCCRAPVIWCEVTEEEFIIHEAIIRRDDPRGEKRMSLMRAKQIVKSVRMQQIHGPSGLEWAKKHLAAIAEEQEKRISLIKKAEKSK